MAIQVSRRTALTGLTFLGLQVVGLAVPTLAKAEENPDEGICTILAIPKI